MSDNLFFVEKIGIYSHGVFWIGADETEAIEKAKSYASADNDDYHEWVVRRFLEPGQTSACEDAFHVTIFRTTKDAAR